jgi:hypothetical protein
MCAAATFTFQQPSVFEAENSLGEITGLFMIDEEGEMNTVDVNAKFVNGKPDAIECKCDTPPAQLRLLVTRLVALPTPSSNQQAPKALPRGAMRCILMMSLPIA